MGRLLLLRLLLGDRGLRRLMGYCFGNRSIFFLIQDVAHQGSTLPSPVLVQRYLGQESSLSGKIKPSDTVASFASSPIPIPSISLSELRFLDRLRTWHVRNGWVERVKWAYSII